MRITLSLILVLLASLPAALRASGEINFAVDIPTPVSAAIYQPFQTVNGYAPAAVWSYSVNAAGPGSGLTPGIHVDGLSQLYTGFFYFSVDAPALISAVTYHPADIISYNGTTYAKLWDHQTDLALGEAANLTGIAFGNGSFHIALDAPQILNQQGGGTINYDPRQVVTIGSTLGTYLMAFNGVTAGIPAGARIAGVEYLSAGNWLLNFDAPVTLGATTYLPGDIVQWNGAVYSLYYRDNAVFPNPPPNAMSDFALPLAPGEANNFKLTKSGAIDVVMTWGNASCAFATTTRDYEVYEGTLGTWYSHNTAKACTTGGVLNTTLTPGGGNQYYLVVPSNGAFEGNYGTGAGGPIPVSSAACRASQATLSCP